MLGMRTGDVTVSNKVLRENAVTDAEAIEQFLQMGGEASSVPAEDNTPKLPDTSLPDVVTFHVHIPGDEDSPSALFAEQAQCLLQSAT
eukprot:6455031-Amphidinium_carterae.1